LTWGFVEIVNIRTRKRRNLNMLEQQIYNCSIIEAEDKDIERVVEIAINAWQPIFEGYKNELGDIIYNCEYPDWKKEKARQIYESFKPQSGARVLLAEINGVIAGFITYYVDKSNSSGIICNNAVDPKFQGKGIAGNMYKYVIEEMKKHKLKYVKVTTGGDAAHLPARKAYEKAGFKKNIPEVNYYMEI